MNELINYYSRKDVQKQIVKVATNKEVGVQYGKIFGKRPDILQFENDVGELAKQGATSFHLSLESWNNPLDLQAGMLKKDLDNLRAGFDVIIDIDCPFLAYSKLASSLIIDAIKFHNIENISLKFSGNRSFHIGLPFNSFPSKVNNIDTKLLFPDGIKVIITYLKKMIKEPLANQILEINTLKEISESLNKDQNLLLENKKFNPFSVMVIDEVLISNRHMYRSQYSLNEKSNLISIPLKLSQLNNFKLSNAKIDNVETNLTFLNPEKTIENESSHLIIQAFDSFKKEEKKITTKPKNFITITNAIKEDLFPPCIKKILDGIKTDGRKRALFVLINFLKNMNWSFEDMEKRINDWNKKNYEPLKDSYVRSQLMWHKNQKQKILPPNCSNISYYTDLGVKCPDNICNKHKNPINYSLRRVKPN
jgi:hypothetical protein|tara:strand:- start:971 stop:2233 length:1263 start_codon:yes stop_codon:yes gene_type:complete